RYRACAIPAVLEAGFGAPIARLGTEDVILRALDGYAKPATLAQLGESGGHLAVGAARGEGVAALGGARPRPRPLHRRGSTPRASSTSCGRSPSSATRTATRGRISSRRSSSRT